MSFPKSKNTDRVHSFQNTIQSSQIISRKMAAATIPLFLGNSYPQMGHSFDLAGISIAQLGHSFVLSFDMNYS